MQNAAATLNKTVMVIDDSAGVRTLARLALEKAGYAVVEACDGLDAVARLADARAVLIVCDINMPQMDGLAFIRRLKELPLHRHTPVLMMTTSVDPTQKAAARKAGVAAWIAKPFDSQALVGAVERLCP